MTEESLKPVGRQRWFGNYDAKMLLALNNKYSPYFQERNKNKNVIRKSSSADSITSQGTSRKSLHSSSSSLNNSFIKGVVTNVINSEISSPTKISANQGQRIPSNQQSINFNALYYPTTPDLLDSTENSLKQGVLLFNPPSSNSIDSLQQLNRLLQQKVPLDQLDIKEEVEFDQKELEEQKQKEAKYQDSNKNKNIKPNRRRMENAKQNPHQRHHKKKEEQQYEEFIYFPQNNQNYTYAEQNIPQQDFSNQEVFLEDNAQYVPNYYQNITNNELQNMLDNAHTLIKDQLGCRLLQNKLDEKNETEVRLICNYLIPHLAQLALDPFGNYLVQKLIEVVSQQQLSEVAEVFYDQIVKNCLDYHGTRVIQKLLTSAKQPLLQKITDVISPHISLLSQELNGNHVIQKCLSLNYPHNQFVFDQVCKNLMEIAVQKHGCCVVQKCIDFANEAQAVQLVNQIVINAIDLVLNPFGNYIIQHVLDKKCTEFNNRIAYVFSTKIVTLCTHKFSSNIIEKVIIQLQCLDLTSEDIQQQLMHEIIKEQHIYVLLCDQYANYGIQQYSCLKGYGNRAKTNSRQILKECNATFIKYKKVQIWKKSLQQTIKKVS